MDRLPYDRTNSTVVVELAYLSFPKLLICYHNWLHRLIQPAPSDLNRE